MKGDPPTTTSLGPREMLSLVVCLEEKKFTRKGLNWELDGTVPTEGLHSRHSRQALSWLGGEGPGKPRHMEGGRIRAESQGMSRM